MCRRRGVGVGESVGEEVWVSERVSEKRCVVAWTVWSVVFPKSALTFVERMIRVGFVGLGKMGYPISSRLSSKYKVFIYNRTQEVSQSHSSSFNSIPMESLDDYQNQSLDYLLTCLPSSIESSLILNHMHRILPISTGFIDLTSGNYQSSVDLAKDLNGRRYFDAPVSGGPKGAQEGTLTSMVGCEQLTEVERELISCYSQKIVLCGSVGHGNAIKGANNFLNMAHLILASDVLIHLQKHGISAEKALEAINQSSGRSLQTEIRLPNEILTRKFNYGFKLNLMRKDILQMKDILQDSLFYSTIENLIEPHEKTVDDYTVIVKDIEKKHKIQLQLSNKLNSTKTNESK